MAVSHLALDVLSPCHPVAVQVKRGGVQWKVGIRVGWGGTGSRSPSQLCRVTGHLRQEAEHPLIAQPGLLGLM